MKRIRESSGWRVWAYLSLFAVFLSFPVWGGDHSGPSGPLRRVSSSDLSQLPSDGDLQLFKTALARQIESCRKKNLEEKWNFGGRMVTRRKWCVETAQALLTLAENSGDFVQLMEKAKGRFEWYQSEGRDGQGEVLFTGYNFPTLRASLTQDSVFRFPLYRKPSDLVQVSDGGKTVWKKRNADGSFSSYFDRKQIDMDSVLKGKGFEIAYTDDLFSAFILQVQGAGQILVRGGNGTERRIILNYAAENGRPYVGISSVLKARGVSAEYLTIPGMRRYFAEHPDQLVPVLNENPSYVFFQISEKGPLGVHDLLLTPLHSVAMDLRVFPVGALAFIQARKPDIGAPEGDSWLPFTRWVVNQDTGGAIRGPGRVDIFWGEDDYAELAAGTMAQKGKLFFALLP